MRSILLSWMLASCAPMFESSRESTFLERARASGDAERHAFVQSANRCLANIDHGILQLGIGLRPSEPPRASLPAWQRELDRLDDRQRALAHDVERAARGSLADFGYRRGELRTSIVALDKRVRGLYEEMASRVSDPTYLAAPRAAPRCRGDLCCPPLGS